MLKPKTKALRTIAYSFFSIIVLGGIIFYLVQNADKYLHLFQISISGVVIIFILSLASPMINGFINILMFKSLGVILPQREAFYLAASSTLANQLPIPGGIITRGIYLKHKYDLSYYNYFGATLALFFCSIIVNGFTGLIVLLYWLFVKDVEVSFLLLLGFSSMVATVSIFFLQPSKLSLPKKIKNWVDQILVGWSLISKEPKFLLRIFIFQIVFMLIFATRQWLAFNMLSHNINYSQTILMSSGAILTQLVSFAPGGLGIREAIIGGIASILGFDLTSSIAAVELDRAISTISIAITGWISTLILGKQITELSQKK